MELSIPLGVSQTRGGGLPLRGRRVTVFSTTPPSFETSSTVSISAPNVPDATRTGFESRSGPTSTARSTVTSGRLGGRLFRVGLIGRGLRFVGSGIAQGLGQVGARHGLRLPHRDALRGQGGVDVLFLLLVEEKHLEGQEEHADADARIRDVEQRPRVRVARLVDV